MHPVTIVAANRKDNSFLLITKILLHINHVTVNDFSSPFVRLFCAIGCSMIKVYYVPVLMSMFIFYNKFAFFLAQMHKL